MLRLEDIQKDSVISGTLPNDPVTCITVLWYGTNNLELIYKDASGNDGQALQSREDEARLSVESAVRPWSFGANRYDFKLAAEAYRISVAYSSTLTFRSIPPMSSLCLIKQLRFTTRCSPDSHSGSFWRMTQSR